MRVAVIRLQAGSRLVVVPEIRTVTFVPEQMSEAVGGVKLQGMPHSTKRSDAQLRTGGRVSTTTIVWLQVMLLRQLSMTRHVRVTDIRLLHCGLERLVTV